MSKIRVVCPNNVKFISFIDFDKSLSNLIDHIKSYHEVIFPLRKSLRITGLNDYQGYEIPREYFEKPIKQFFQVNDKVKVVDSLAEEEKLLSGQFLSIFGDDDGLEEEEEEEEIVDSSKLDSFDFDDSDEESSDEEDEDDDDDDDEEEGKLTGKKRKRVEVEEEIEIEEETPPGKKRKLDDESSKIEEGKKETTKFEEALKFIMDNYSHEKSFNREQKEKLRRLYKELTPDETNSLNTLFKQIIRDRKSRVKQQQQEQVVPQPQQE